MKQSLVILVLAVGFFGWLFYSSDRHAAVQCEGCVTFEGATACAKAAAQTREDALRQVATVACTEISSGMADSIRCNQADPEKVTCTGEAAAEAPAKRY